MNGVKKMRRNLLIITLILIFCSLAFFTAIPIDRVQAAPLERIQQQSEPNLQAGKAVPQPQAWTIITIVGFLFIGISVSPLLETDHLASYLSNEDTFN
jgi:hypothetical protein